MSEELRKTYIIKPIYKKSALEKQEWVNTLSNGKSVTVLVCNLYRWASFTIELTDKEKEFSGITQGLIRISAGLEDIDDLISGLKKGLD